MLRTLKIAKLCVDTSNYFIADNLPPPRNQCFGSGFFDLRLHERIVLMYLEDQHGQSEQYAQICTQCEPFVEAIRIHNCPPDSLPARMPET